MLLSQEDKYDTNSQQDDLTETRENSKKKSTTS